MQKAEAGALNEVGSHLTRQKPADCVGLSVDAN